MPRSILDDDLSSCPNGILAGFLRDWWAEAKENNARSASAYKRAYDSMKAYPIKFTHPHEAVILKGIKDVLANRLADQYDKYCVAVGIPKPQKPGRSAETTGDQRPGDAAPAEPVTTARRNRAKKPYVPTQGSGSYALLRALYEAFQLGERVTKDQLQLRAAPYSKTSFEAPAHAGSFYTAWAGMKRLKDEGLVFESGHPKKYEISDAGVELWDKIAAAESGGAAVAGRRESSVGATEGSGTLVPPVLSRQASGKRKKTSAIPVPKVISLEDDDDDEEEEKEEEELPPPPRRRRISPSNHTTSGTGDGREIHLGDAFGQIQDASNSDEEGPTTAQLKAQRAAMRERYAGVPQEYQSTGRNALHRASNTAISAAPTSTLTRTNSAPSAGPSRTSTNTLSRTASMHSNPAPLGNQTRARSREPSAAPGLNGNFPSFTPECLKAGTYDIELILDNREVRSRHDRDYLQNNLGDRGVHPQTRALQVGDVLWIAREKSGLQREVVLDYIVERKRLDDLVGSIKDGRYHEQKFRLEKSKIRNVIYIVEDTKLNEADKESMLDSVHSAIAGTMVCDGFFVKRTSKLDDTIRYLVLMTTRLKQEYSNKDLYITPPHLVDTRTYSSLLTHLSTTHPTKSFHPTYTTFSSLVQKSGSQTLRDIFLKLLLCTRGLGIEKAVAIQRVFPTPAALTSAYRACRTKEEREALLVAKCDSQLVAGRKIGKALSRKVAEIWWGQYGRILEDAEGE